MKKMIVLLLAAALCCAGAAWAESGLPAYTYPGNNPIEAAVAAYTVELGKNYRTVDGGVTIPAPVILKTAEQDDLHLRVYGNFWVFHYAAEDGILSCVSGGEAPGIITLVKQGDRWEVEAMETAGDGADYAKDIRRFANGDAELEAAYFTAHEQLKGVRTRFIREYVNANSLDIAAYQDFGWDAIPLHESNAITGRLEDGSYLVRIPVEENENGAWTAEDGSQDDSVVTLQDAKLENGAFEARYDPAGDGETTVTIRHMNGIACDQAHTFDLLVQDGKIREVTGGSYTASPSDAELADAFAGDWRDRETRLTQMTVAAGEKGGLAAEILVPSTHGAYLFRLTMHYDCVLNAFLYDDGVVYSLPITDTAEPALGEPVSQNLGGCLKLAEENDTVLLCWHSQLTPNEPDIVFFRMDRETAGN